MPGVTAFPTTCKSNPGLQDYPILVKDRVTKILNCFHYNLHPSLWTRPSGLIFQTSLPLNLLWPELIHRLQTFKAVPAPSRVLSMSHSLVRGLLEAHMSQNGLIHGPQVAWGVLLPPEHMHSLQHFHSSSHRGSIQSSIDTAEVPWPSAGPGISPLLLSEHSQAQQRKGTSSTALQ